MFLIYNYFFTVFNRFYDVCVMGKTSGVSYRVFLFIFCKNIPDKTTTAAFPKLICALLYDCFISSIQCIGLTMAWMSAKTGNLEELLTVLCMTA